jgi:thymidylate kinase
MKGIILDGMVATGKTTVLKHVNQLLATNQSNCSKIFLTEHYTQRMLEHFKDGDLISSKYISKHTKEIIRNLETYQDMLSVSKFSENISNAEMYVVVERFIFTLMTSSKENQYYTESDVAADLLRLRRINVKQIVLKIPEDKILERIMDTLQYRNDYWKGYLKSIGNEEEIFNYFLKWQQSFLNNVEKYKKFIETHIIEVPDKNFEKISDQIYEFIVD